VKQVLKSAAAEVTESRREERVKQRRKAAATRATPENLSYLESVTIGPGTEVDYRRRLGYFISWARTNQADWGSYRQLDVVICQYFDERFFEGWTADDGAKLLGALAFADPNLCKGTASMLPRASRAVKGWTKVGPAEQRLPLPWCLLLVIMADMFHRCLFAQPVCLLVQQNCYLRPGEVVSMLVKQLVSPTAGALPPYDRWAVNVAPFELLRPAKTGMMDESVTLDFLEWAHPVFETLVRGRRGDEPLWPFDLAGLAAEFKLSVARVGLEHLRPTLYSIRHSGASEDYLRKRRSLEDIQRRGRWRTQASVRRYTKEAKLLSELHKVPTQLLRYADFLESRVSELFLTPSSVPTFAAWCGRFRT